MALDATVGSLTANSYVTVEEADAYFAERMHSAKWESVADPVAALITASRILDWQLTFDGYKVSELQSMQFPRTGVVLSSGYEVPSDIIPQEIKYATMELALAFLSGDRTVDSPLSGIEQVKAGPLFVKATPAGMDSTNAKIIPDHIRKMLADFIANSSMYVVRLMRA